MKKVLIISASPRKGGNSDTLCDEFLRGAKDAGHDVEKIFLRDKKINYCTGCGLCNTNGYSACSQKDDAPEILEKMVNADVIVLATPVYFYTMDGQGFRGFTDCCLDNPIERGVLKAAGVWQKGEVKATRYMQMAYDMGKNS